MKSNLKIYLLISGLLILVLGLAACGRTSVPGDRVNTVPHAVDWGFENCLVCHTGGDIALPPIFHPTNPTNEDCLNPGCHAVQGATTTPTTTTPTATTTTTTPTTTTPTTTEPTTTTTEPTTTTPTTTEPTTTTPPTTTTVEPPLISVEFHPGLEDTSICFICHVGEEGQVVDPWPASHAEEGHANDSCLDDGCHQFEQQ